MGIQGRSVRVFMYILRFDGGFAPNPFHGSCTLACCKPAIRKKAQPGDWVVGITPANLGNRVAYAMRVEQTLSFGEYWSRFPRKRPRRHSSRSRKERVGDNCYEPIGGGEFRALASAHWESDGDPIDVARKKRDLSVQRVLVASRFCYFGAEAKRIPASITVKLPARYNRVHFTEKEKAALIRFLERLPQGVQARPRGWTDDDGSWKEMRSECG